jgi:hypothetical protein
MVLLVGTLALRNFAVLGWIPFRETTGWTRAGFAITAITGPLLYASDLHRYNANPAFASKMILLLGAILFQLLAPPKSRAGAVVSLVLWGCVVLAARAIADFDIV